MQKREITPTMVMVTAELAGGIRILITRLNKWCDKYCHPQPQWCSRPNCMNKADYKKAMENKQKANVGQNNKFSNNFKVALSAIVLDEDYKALETQFFSKAGK